MNPFSVGMVLVEVDAEIMCRFTRRILDLLNNDSVQEGSLGDRNNA
jgi:hypothetical protein